MKHAQIVMIGLIALSLGFVGCDNAKKGKSAENKKTAKKEEKKSDKKTEKKEEKPKDTKKDEKKADAKGTPEIVPGKSIGSLKLGMSFKDVLGLKMGFEEPLSPTARSAQSGPYGIVWNDKKEITMVSFDLGSSKAGIKYKDKQLAKDIKLEDAAKLVEGCGKLEPRTGGNLIRCKDLYMNQGGLAKTIGINISSEPLK